MPRFRIDMTDEPPAVPSWIPINLKPASTADPTKEARLAAQHAVAELLQCDQVVVLAGLGTSLCIKDDDNETVFPTMSALWDMVSAKVGTEVFRDVQEAVGLTSGRNIEELLSRCQMKLGLEPTPSAYVGTTDATAASPSGPDILKFVKEAEEVIRTECRKTLTNNATEVHEDFLRRLVRREPRRPRTNLFTTNYGPML